MNNLPIHTKVRILFEAIAHFLINLLVNPFVSPERVMDHVIKRLEHALDTTKENAARMLAEMATLNDNLTRIGNESSMDLVTKVERQRALYVDRIDRSRRLVLDLEAKLDHLKHRRTQLSVRNSWLQSRREISRAFGRGTDFGQFDDVFEQIEADIKRDEVLDEMRDRVSQGQFSLPAAVKELT